MVTTRLLHPDYDAKNLAEKYSFVAINVLNEKSVASSASLFNYLIIKEKEGKNPYYFAVHLDDPTKGICLGRIQGRKVPMLKTSAQLTQLPTDTDLSVADKKILTDKLNTLLMNFSYSQYAKAIQGLDVFIKLTRYLSTLVPIKLLGITVSGDKASQTKVTVFSEFLNELNNLNVITWVNKLNNFAEIFKNDLEPRPNIWNLVFFTVDGTAKEAKFTTTSHLLEDLKNAVRSVPFIVFPEANKATTPIENFPSRVLVAPQNSTPIQSLR